MYFETEKSKPYKLGRRNLNNRAISSNHDDTTLQCVSSLWARRCRSHASAAHLWSFYTLSCPVSCVWPLVMTVMSYLILYSPPLSRRSTASLVFPSSWLHEHSRCMLSWGIFHPVSGSDVQNSAVTSSKFCQICCIWYIYFLSVLYISSFLILSLLIAPSILRRHAISNPLSFCFCFSYNLYSMLYTHFNHRQYSEGAIFCAFRILSNDDTNPDTNPKRPLTWP